MKFAPLFEAYESLCSSACECDRIRCNRTMYLAIMAEIDRMNEAFGWGRVRIGEPPRLVFFNAAVIRDETVPDGEFIFENTAIDKSVTVKAQD